MENGSTCWLPYCPRGTVQRQNLVINNSGNICWTIGLLKEHVGNKITVIVDNASIHKPKAAKPMMDLLKKQGVTLYFLPPYSPDLKRIENLWHLMKYTWISVKSRNSKTLEADVDEILDNFGSKYKFSL